MKDKKTLNEATIRRFMKLAGTHALTETFVEDKKEEIQEEAEEVQEEGHYKAFTRNDDKFNAQLIWPLTEFNEFVIDELTRKPIQSRTLMSLITSFNHTIVFAEDRKSFASTNQNKNLYWRFRIIVICQI